MKSVNKIVGLNIIIMLMSGATLAQAPSKLGFLKPTTDVLVTGNGPINLAQLASDGTKMLTTSNDGRVVQVYDLKIQKVIATINHSKYVNSVQFSPDGTKIVYATEEGAEVYDIKTQKVIVSIKNAWLVVAAQFSPDGTKIVIASAHDGHARVYDFKTQKVIATINHTKHVNSAQFSSDGTKVVTASADGSAKVYDLNTQAVIATVKHGSYILSAQFSPGSDKVLTTSTDASAQVYDLKSQKVIATIKRSDRIISAQFSSDGTKVVTAADDGAEVYDLKNQKVIADIKRSALIKSAQFSPGSDKVLTSWDDTNVQVYDLNAQKVTVQIKHGHSIRLAQFSQDGGEAIIASDKGLQFIIAQEAQSYTLSVPDFALPSQTQFQSACQNGTSLCSSNCFNNDHKLSAESPLSLPLSLTSMHWALLRFQKPGHFREDQIEDYSLLQTILTKPSLINYYKKDLELALQTLKIFNPNIFNQCQDIFAKEIKQLNLSNTDLGCRSLSEAQSIYKKINLGLEPTITGIINYQKNPTLLKTIFSYLNTAHNSPHTITAAALDVPANLPADYYLSIIKAGQTPAARYAKTFNPTPAQGLATLNAIFKNNPEKKYNKKELESLAWFIASSGVELTPEILAQFATPDLLVETQKLVATDPLKYKGDPNFAVMQLGAALLATQNKLEDFECGIKGDLKDPQTGAILHWFEIYGDHGNADKLLFAKIAVKLLANKKLCPQDRNLLFTALRSWRAQNAAVQQELTCAIIQTLDQKPIASRGFEELLLVTKSIGLGTDHNEPSFYEQLKAYAQIKPRTDLDDVEDGLLKYVLGLPAGTLKGAGTAHLKIAAALSHKNAIVKLCRVIEKGTAQTLSQGAEHWFKLLNSQLSKPRRYPESYQKAADAPTYSTLEEEFKANDMADDLMALKTNCATLPALKKSSVVKTEPPAAPKSPAKLPTQKTKDSKKLFFQPIR